jgi:hypothetical protein
MPHPQFHELCNKLRTVWEIPASLLDADASVRPILLLSVSDPESKKKKALFMRCPIITEGDRWTWAVRMVFSWPEIGDRERAIAERLGLPAPTITVQTGRNPFTGGPFQIRSSGTSCEIGDIDHAASLCLEVMRELYGIPEDRRLRIRRL